MRGCARGRRLQGRAGFPHDRGCGRAAVPPTAVSPVLGFLAAGVALGPFGLGRLAPRRALARRRSPSRTSKRWSQLAEFGVVFLLFMIGLELSWERLSRMRRLVFGLGRAAGRSARRRCSAAGACSRSCPAGARAGHRRGAGAVLDRHRHAGAGRAQAARHRPRAGRAFAVLLFQDLAVAPLLVMVTVLAAAQTATSGAGLLLALAPAAAGAVVLSWSPAGCCCGRCSARWRRAQSDELFMAACLLVVIGAGAVAAVERPVDGARRLHRRPAAGRDRVPPRGRGDDRAVQGPAARPVLRLRRRRPRPVAARRRAAARSLGLALGLVARQGGAICCAWRAPSGCRAGSRREAALLLAPGGEFAFVMITAGDAPATPVDAATGAGGARRRRPCRWCSIPLLAVGWASGSPGGRRMRRPLAGRRRAAARGRARRVHHRRLRPGRAARRRDADASRHALDRGRPRPRLVAARARGRQGDLLRRRHPAGLPAPLRHRQARRWW